MDRALRTLLYNAVVECRRLLERDFSLQLEGVYGMHADGSCEPLAGLRHLDAVGRADREAIAASIRHEEAAGSSRRRGRRRAPVVAFGAQAFGVSLDCSGEAYRHPCEPTAGAPVSGVEDLGRTWPHFVSALWATRGGHVHRNQRPIFVVSRPARATGLALGAGAGRGLADGNQYDREIL